MALPIEGNGNSFVAFTVARRIADRCDRVGTHGARPKRFTVGVTHVLFTLRGSVATLQVSVMLAGSEASGETSPATTDHLGVSMVLHTATVPAAHLATAVGDPNQLVTEYSTDVLLPVPGPYAISKVRRDFVEGVMRLNDVLLLAEDVRTYVLADNDLEIRYPAAPLITPRRGDVSRYGQLLTPAVRSTARVQGPRLGPGERGPVLGPGRDGLGRDPIDVADQDPREVLLNRAGAPNPLFRELFDAGVLQASSSIVRREYLETEQLDERFSVAVRPLLEARAPFDPRDITDEMGTMARAALIEAARRYPAFRAGPLARLSRESQPLLVRWMAAYHGAKVGLVPSVEILPGIIGFELAAREWAFNRRERMRIVFGTPELRGPIGADPIPPQGTYTDESFVARETELTLGDRTARQETSTQAEALTAGTLRRALDRVYYSGTGALDQLTSQASNSLLREQRRAAVTSLVRQVSESQERSRLERVATTTTSTVTRVAVGVDEERAATQHRMQVVVPIDVTAEMCDVGLTWAPRIFNPFYALRQAIYAVYYDAYTEHVQRYYVPEPTRPGIVWDSFTASTSITMEGEEVATANFTITLQPSDREQRPDLDNATVVWNQDESFWNDDPDHFTAVLQNLAFGANRITGRVRLETNDGGADFQGTADISVPVLRYSQDTVNRLAEYEAELADAEYRRDALAAQARQYARVKQREFIERHSRLDDLNAIVFDELIRIVCTNTNPSNHSYYSEVISRTIDWTNAKIAFEPAPLGFLAFPEFPPDHFVNSLGVRFFLPIIATAEDVLFDTLEQCGSFQVRNQVAQVSARIDEQRQRLEQDGPDELDRFDSELVIGQHIEAVMSDSEMSD